MPFFPFIIGAAVGGAVTYVLKDDSSKEMLKDTGDKITDGASTLKEKVAGVFSKGKDTAEDAADEVVDAVEDADAEEVVVA